MVRVRRTIVVSSFFLCVLLSVEGGSADGVQEEELIAITSRDAWSSYSAHVAVERTAVEDGQTLASQAVYDIWFENESIRVDRTYPTSANPAGIKREVACQGCEGDGNCVLFQVRQDGTTIGPVWVGSIKDEGSIHLQVFDIRKVGFIGAQIETLSRQFDLNTVVASEKRDAETVERDEFVEDSKPLVRIRCTKPWKALVTMVLSPSEAMVPVELIGETDTRLETTKTTYTEMKGVFVPTWTEYVIKRKSDDVEILRQTATIQYDSINEPIDPAVFSIESMDIPPKTLVTREDGGYFVWTGDREVAEVTARELRPRNMTRLALYVVSVVLAVTTGFLVFRRKR